VNTLDYMGATWGKASGDSWIGCCPIHPEHEPSFQVWPDEWNPGEWCWTCYHENRSGDLPRLINIKEFGDVNVTSTWREVYKRCKELGVNIPQKDFTPREQREKLGASQEQRALLTAVMHWWHKQLWSSTSYGQRGREYYKQRGISLPDLRPYAQLGYAPPTLDGRIRHEFLSLLQDVGGSDWKHLATGLGLLSKKTGNISGIALPSVLSMNKGNASTFRGVALPYLTIQGRYCIPIWAQELYRRFPLH
jgi:hypothetical protein